jgi:hypothetical protein
MIGKDIVPTLDSDRIMTKAGFAWTWAGMSIILTGFMLPAQMYPALTGWGIYACFCIRLLSCCSCSFSYWRYWYKIMEYHFLYI